MPKNQIQFQKGLSLPEFLRNYGSEEQCKEAVFKLKWKDGFICSECGSTSYCKLKARPVYQCNRCHFQTTLLAKTIFEHSKLPLTKWFLGIYLVTQSKNSISALSLGRHLGVSYNAAWRLKHKLMQVMKEEDDRQMLEHAVQLDDCYVGGKQKGKRGRGAKGKTSVVAAVSIDENQHPIHMRLSVVSGFKKQEIKKWAQAHLKQGVHIISDGLACFKSLETVSFKHERTVKMGQKLESYETTFKWVDTMIGNVKNSIRGTCHAIRSKHVPRYLGEFCFRFNHRFKLDELFNKLVSSATKSPPMPYRLLKLAEARW